MFNRGGYKKVGSWINLLLIIAGFFPGVGDAIKAFGKAAIKGVKKVTFTAARGLWHAASRHLVEPLVRHLFTEPMQKMRSRIRTFLEERAAKAAEREGTPGAAR